MKQRIRGQYQPRLIAERKPLRPVHVTATRQPIKVTKPITFGGATIPARPAR